MSREQYSGKINKAIHDDVDYYVHHLSQEKQRSVLLVTCYEHPDGRFAVQITLALNGTWKEHLLIYNAKHERIKVIVYTSGYYMSQGTSEHFAVAKIPSALTAEDF